MALIAHAPEFSIVSKIISNPNPRNVKSFRATSKSGAIGAKARIKVCSEVKGCVIGVSKWDQYVRQHCQFATPLKGGSKMSKEEEEKHKYYVNMGYAIRTLREEFPELFFRELSFDIYRDDIVFKDPLNTFAGIENYKSILWGLRFHGRIFFRALWVDIIGVWQPMESVVMVRWTVHGIPRVPWESRSRFDGTSEYKLDKEGKIYEHRVDNIALNLPPPKFRVLTVEELVQAIGCPSTPKLTYFEASSSVKVTELQTRVEKEG